MESTRADPVEHDDELVAQLQRADATAATAIEALYDRYGGQAYGLAYRIMNDKGAAEDVVQEAFVAVWRNAGGFTPGRGSVRNWLLAIVHHRAIDRLRGTARFRRDSSLEEAALVTGADDVWDTVSTRLERGEIKEAFARLPEAQRRTLELAYFGGFTHAEIAGQMNVPLGTVKGRMRIGLEKMRSLLQPTGVEL